VFTGKLPLGRAVLRPIEPLILSQTRTTFSLVVLLPLLVASQGWQRIRLPARDLAYCFILGMLGVAVSNYFYYVAIQRTNVATAIIVQYTAPVWVLLYVVARGQQRLTVQKSCRGRVGSKPESLWSSISSEPSLAQRFTWTPTASSPRCWPRSLLPSTTSADTASSPATTAGGCSSGPLPRPQPSGSLSILLENRRRPLHSRPMDIPFRFFDDFGAWSILSLLPRTAASRAHPRYHRQLPGAGGFPFFWLPCCWEKCCVQSRRWESSSCLRPS